MVAAWWRHHGLLATLTRSGGAASGPLRAAGDTKYALGPSDMKAAEARRAVWAVPSRLHHLPARGAQTLPSGPAGLASPRRCRPRRGTPRAGGAVKPSLHRRSRRVPKLLLLVSRKARSSSSRV